MVMKSEKQVKRYLPELEDKINLVFDKVYTKDYPSLSLSEDEKYNLKQMLKFLCSNEELDAFTKRFGINRVRKLLISTDEKDREKGNLILQLLNNLNSQKSSNEIVDGMPISRRVIELTFKARKDKADQQEGIHSLTNILHELNKIKNNVDAIKHNILQYDQNANIRVSQSGEAVNFFNKFSFSLKNNGNICEADDPWILQHNFFVYVGDLEKKLNKVMPKTWGHITGDKSIKDLICFYTPELPAKHITLSQEQDEFVCRTLQEVFEVVRRKRNKSSKRKNKGRKQTK